MDALDMGRALLSDDVERKVQGGSSVMPIPATHQGRVNTGDNK